MGQLGLICQVTGEEVPQQNSPESMKLILAKTSVVEEDQDSSKESGAFHDIPGASSAIFPVSLVVSSLLTGRL